MVVVGVGREDLRRDAPKVTGWIAAGGVGALNEQLWPSLGHEAGPRSVVLLGEYFRMKRWWTLVATQRQILAPRWE